MNDICNVKNRSGSHVVYNIPELGVRRSFAPGEVKKISFEVKKSITGPPSKLSHRKRS